MTRCPFCFYALDRPEAAFVCDNPQQPCPDLPDPAYKHFRSLDLADSRPVATWRPKPEDRRPQLPDYGFCGQCGSRTRTQACPRCHEPLPVGWRSMRTTCVAVAGPRTSGKSIYIAVLKRQTELLVQQLGGALGYADDWTAKTYVEVYEKPLWKQRGVVNPTARIAAPREGEAAPQRRAMIFSLGSLNNGPHMLVIRDVAGEDLEDAGIAPGPYTFFRDADGILFLVDPLKRDKIRLLLQGLVDQDLSASSEPLAVLDNVARLIREPGDRQKIMVPVAVILSKFDALREMRKVPGSRWDAVMANAGSACNRDPSQQPGFDAEDADLLQAEVSSMLDRLGEQSIRNRLDSEFAVTRLFAVSALGAPPKGKGLSAHGIAPFRCLDPLKWVLNRTGAVPAA